MNATSDGIRWTNGSWRTTYGCTDWLTGCVFWAVRLDDTDYQNPELLSLTDERRYMIQSISVDCASNQSPVVVSNYGIDRTAPVTFMQNRDNSTYVPGVLPLQAHAEDDLLADGSEGSGVRELCFDVTRVPIAGERDAEHLGCFTATQSGSTWTASPLLPLGRYTVFAIARDVVGLTGSSGPVHVFSLGA